MQHVLTTDCDYDNRFRLNDKRFCLNDNRFCLNAVHALIIFVAFGVPYAWSPSIGVGVVLFSWSGDSSRSARSA